MAGTGAVFFVTALVIPSDVGHAVFYLGLAAGCVVALIAAAITNRSSGALPWRFFAVALTLFFVGDLFFYYYDVVKGEARPFPSLADVCYLSSYPLMIAGAVVLIRRRRLDGPAAWIDAAMIAIGVGVVLWVFIIQPVASTGNQPMLDRLISTAYPTMDVLLLSVAARLAVMTSGRRPDYWLLGLGVVGLLVADAASGVIQLSHAFHTGTIVDAGWMLFYFCWALAAWHPAARSAPSTLPDQSPGSHWTRLLALTATCLLAPTVLAVRWSVGVEDQWPVLIASSVVLFILAQARMFVLSRALVSTASREISLRNSAASFVTAVDADGVRHAALAAVRAVVGRNDVVIALVEVDGATTVLRTGSHTTDTSASSSTVRGISFHGLEALARRALGDDVPSESISISLYAPGGLRGLLVVASDTPLPSEVRLVVEALGSQIALALESASLTADLLRREGEVRFRSLVQNSSDVITVLDCDAVITYQSPSVEHVLGYEDASLVGTSLLDLVHPADVTQTAAFLDRVTNHPTSTLTTAHRLLHTDGDWVSTETVGANLLDDPSVVGIVLTTRDVSERQAFEAQLIHQAFHDPLTGLANRLLFADRVQKALAQRRSDTGPLAVIFLDLDDYKTVNDSLGHHAGDEVLITVAARLNAWIRNGDTIARMGGDEFAVLLPTMADRQVALDVAERIGAALDEVFHIDGNDVFIGASLGIAFVERDSGDIDPEELLRNADVAMYTAKSRGKHCCAIFESSMHAAVLHRLQFKADLQHAFDNDEFTLYYQPIMSSESERLSGVEALVRWHSPHRGVVPPDAFITLAEETGLIVPLGRWILHEALAQADRWSFAERSLTMSVNLSAMQLQQAAFPADVAAALATTGLPADVLTLEITESMLMGDLESSVARLHELRGLGIGLVIDDFGTGYSSLSYLRQLPINGLKIDKEFVDAIRFPANASPLLTSVINLARSLGLRTTAEGVETRHQFERLQALGCDLAQGFLFGQAVPAQRFELMLPALEVDLDVDRDLVGA